MPTYTVQIEASDDARPNPRSNRTMSEEAGRTVTITFREYMDLYKDSVTLNELESQGVDNWGGYDEIDRTAIADACRAERNRIIHGEVPQ